MFGVKPPVANPEAFFAGTTGLECDVDVK